MAEHRLLTGADLHEPKGADTAVSGQVYVANGSGSGSWIDRFNGILNLNKSSLTLAIPNISTPDSTGYVVVPSKSSLTALSVVLYGTITGANDTLTLLKNGIAQAQTVTVNATGSGPGVVTSATINPAISFNAGDTLAVRSNGASDGDFAANVTLSLTAVA